MLKDADRIGEPLHVIQRELGELERLLSQGLDREPRAMVMPVVAARLAERGEVVVGDLAPDHLAAQQVGTFAHRIEARLVLQQTVHRRRDGRAVTGTARARHDPRPAAPRRASRASR